MAGRRWPARARRHRAAGQRHGGRRGITVADRDARGLPDGGAGGLGRDGRVRLPQDAARAATVDLYGGRDRGTVPGGAVRPGAGAAQPRLQRAAHDLHATTGGMRAVAAQPLARDVSWLHVTRLTAALVTVCNPILFSTLGRLAP